MIGHCISALQLPALLQYYCINQSFEEPVPGNADGISTARASLPDTPTSSSLLANLVLLSPVARVSHAHPSGAPRGLNLRHRSFPSIPRGRNLDRPLSPVSRLHTISRRGGSAKIGAWPLCFPRPQSAPARCKLQPFAKHFIAASQHRPPETDRTLLPLRVARKPTCPVISYLLGVRYVLHCIPGHESSADRHHTNRRVSAKYRHLASHQNTSPGSYRRKVTDFDIHVSCKPSHFAFERLPLRSSAYINT